MGINSIKTELRSIMATAQEYEHYAKCQLPIKVCLICRYVWGNMTQGEQHKYRKRIDKNGKQTLALYKDFDEMKDEQS